MSDHEQIVPGKVRIHRGGGDDKYDENGKRKRPPADSMQSFMTREEAMTHLATAVNAVGDKMYEQFTGEMQEVLDEMERRVVLHVIEYLETRTFTGRWKRRFTRWLRRARGEQRPELVKEETTSMEIVTEQIVDRPPSELSAEAIESARRRVVEASE